MNILNYKKFVVVGGMPRSGTTLISNQLQSLGIDILPELHFFSACPRKKLIELHCLPSEVLQFDNIKNVYNKYAGKEKNVENYRAIITECSDENSKWVGEKTPANLEFFRKMINYDDMYFIILKRDYLSIIRSINNTPWKKKNWIRLLIRCIKYHFISYRMQKKSIEKVIIISYEEYCKAPERKLFLIKKHLKINKIKITKNRNIVAESEEWKIGSDKKPFINKVHKASNYAEKIINMVDKIMNKFLKLKTL